MIYVPSKLLHLHKILMQSCLNATIWYKFEKKEFSEKVLYNITKGLPNFGDIVIVERNGHFIADQFFLSGYFICITIKLNYFCKFSDYNTLMWLNSEIIKHGILEFIEFFFKELLNTKIYKNWNEFLNFDLKPLLYYIETPNSIIEDYEKNISQLIGYRIELYLPKKMTLKFIMSHISYLDTVNGFICIYENVSKCFDYFCTINPLKSSKRK